MTLKDLKKMTEKTLFCANGGLQTGAINADEIYLDRADEKIIIMVKSDIPYRRMGVAMMEAGEERGSSSWYAESYAIKRSLLKHLVCNDETKQLRFSFVNSEASYLSVGSSSIHIRGRPYGALNDTFEKFIDAFKMNQLSKVFSCSFSVSRLSFLEALGMVTSIILPQFSCLLYLTVSSGRLVLQTFDFDDSVETEIPCDYSGEETRLTFEVKLLREIIEHIDTERFEIRFCMRGVDTAILPVHSAQLAMPKYDYFFTLSQRMKWRETR